MPTLSSIVAMLQTGVRYVPSCLFTNKFKSLCDTDCCHQKKNIHETLFQVFFHMTKGSVCISLHFYFQTMEDLLKALIYFPLQRQSRKQEKKYQTLSNSFLSNFVTELLTMMSFSDLMYTTMQECEHRPILFNRGPLSFC